MILLCILIPASQSELQDGLAMTIHGLQILTAEKGTCLPEFLNI
jgi:hypothetical protein